MACVNPNSPEYKSALARLGNPLLAELEVQSLDIESKDEVQYNRESLPSVEDQNKQIAENVITELANQLASNLGIQYELVSPELAREITSKASNPWNGESAFYFNGKVYFVGQGFTVTNVLHEFSHPLIDAVFAQNAQLFNKLYADLENTPEGKEIIEEVKALYTDLETLGEAQKKEILVRALSKAAHNDTFKIKNSQSFKDFVNRVLFAIKQLLRKVFGQSVKVEKLDVNTSIYELADMLRSDKFNISTETISEKDYVDYLRDISNFTQELESVEYSDVALTVNRFYDLVSNHIRRIRENKNYSEARKFLVDDTGRGQLQELQSTLQNSEIDEKLSEILDDVELRKKTTQSFVHSILRLDKLTSSIFNHVNELAKQGDSKEIIANIFYYDLLMRNWSKFIDESVNRLSDAGLPANSELGRVISGVKNTIDQTSRKINKIYASNVGNILYDNLENLAKGVDDYFSKTITELQSKNAPQKKIDEVQKQWDKLKLTKEKFQELITGKLGDTNMYSAFLEAYTNSPDPVVGGFAMLIKNAYNEVDAETQRNYNAFVKELEPLLKKAGYNRTDYSELMEQLIHEESIPYFDENGDFKTKKVWAFKDQWLDYLVHTRRLKHEYEQAIEEGDEVLAEKKRQELNKEKIDYFHQEYVPEYYKRESIYTNSPFGKEALKRKQLILSEIKELDSQSYDEDSLDEIAEQKRLLWREYAQLASLTDRNGNPKTGDELEIAKVEREYRKKSREFFEWVPIQGMFESNLRRYEQTLVDEGIDKDSDEFKNKRDKWIKNNTVIAYTGEFFEQRNELLARLRDIMSTLPEQMRNTIDVSADMESLLDMATGFRDQDGQIIGTDISEASKSKVRQVQQSIIAKREKYAGFSGLTKSEMSELTDLFQMISDGQRLSPEDRNRIDELINKKAALGLDKFTKTEIQTIFAQLAELQSKEATDYYVDIVNEYMGKLGKPLIDNESANDLLNPNFYVELFQESPEFEKWFKENHIQKEVFDKSINDTKIVYERLFIWNRTRPNNEDHYEKITLSDGEQIKGKPNLSYYYRAVKKQYRTKRIVGKTVDNRGNWLPKTIEEGAVDDKYYNPAFEQLKRQNPAAFAVLEKMKEYHLKFQEGLPKESRLYLQIPRYRKPNLEYLKDVKSSDVKGTFKEWGSAIKQLFFKASDDYQDGLSFNPEQLVYTDMFNEEINKVPITGLYDLELDQVSMNIPDSMLRYMHSGLKQRKLIEMNPYAQALKKAVSDPDNVIKDGTKINKWMYLNSGIKSFLPKKGMKVRANAINNLYEREFEGKTTTGWLSDNAFVQKLLSNLSKIASTGLFAFNVLPSALKNRQSAVIQLNIESAGGRFVNMQSYLLGKGLAWKMLAEHSAQLYNTKNRSLNSQLLQIFDPTQGMFETILGGGAGQDKGGHFGRSLASDAASLTWLMSPRKFLDIEVQIELFSGVMHHVKVKQTINGQEKEIRYIDAWEVKNGQIELKPGIDPEWAPGKSKFNEVKNRVHEINNRIVGTYATFDQPEAQRYPLFRLLSFLKRYFTSMLMNRVGATRISPALGTVTTGYLRSNLKVIRDFMRHGISNYQWMTDEEKTNFLKFVADAVQQVALLFILSAIFGYDDSDEDRFEKMRKRSGALNEDDFNLGGWLTNHGLAATLGTLSEVETFGSWNPVTFKTNGDIDFTLFERNWTQVKTTTKNVADPRTLYSIVLEKPLNALTHFDQFVRDDPSGFYKRDVGPYWYQKQNSPKFINDVARIFGFTGSQIDPIKAVKGMEFGRK